MHDFTSILAQSVAEERQWYMWVMEGSTAMGKGSTMQAAVQPPIFTLHRVQGSLVTPY